MLPPSLHAGQKSCKHKSKENTLNIFSRVMTPNIPELGDCSVMCKSASQCHSFAVRWSVNSKCFYFPFYPLAEQPGMSMFLKSHCPKVAQLDMCASNSVSNPHQIHLLIFKLHYSNRMSLVLGTNKLPPCLLIVKLTLALDSKVCIHLIEQKPWKQTNFSSRCFSEA